MRPTAATKPSFFLGKHQPTIPASSRAGAGAVAADPCKQAKKTRCASRSWRAALVGSNDGADADDGGDEDGQSVSTVTRARRWARLSARRRESIRLLDVLEDGGGADAGGGIGEFLRHPAGVQSLLNTRALQSFAPVESSDPGTFRCTLHPMGFLGFQVAPVLDLRVIPTCTDCTVEMLSCRFEGTGSIEQQNELFSAFMRNHITWGDNGEKPCLNIDVNLEVTLEVFSDTAQHLDGIMRVYTKPFSLLPLSAVEKPGNLLMQGLLDRLVPMLGEQLLRNYHSWVQQQPKSSS